MSNLRQTPRVVHRAELALLRSLHRAGQAVALYNDARRGGLFLPVGLDAAVPVAPRTFRRRRLAGFVNLESGAVEAAPSCCWCGVAIREEADTVPAGTGRVMHRDACAGEFEAFAYGEG